MKSQLTQVSNYISGVVIEARISDGVVTFRVPGKHLQSFLKLFFAKSFGGMEKWFIFVYGFGFGDGSHRQSRDLDHKATPEWKR